MSIKSIESKQEHEKALNRVQLLWEAKPNTPEAEELELLVTSIEAYEKEHYPIDKPAPEYVKNFRMEQQRTKLIWTGENAIEVSEFIGREDFCHKHGVLIVKNNSSIAYVNKGDSVEINNSGDVINKIQPNDLEPVIVKATKKLLDKE